VNKDRLLNVARALRESPKPEAFYMGEYAQDCGTPACALGHYAHRVDLQDVFMLRDNLVFLCGAPIDAWETHYDYYDDDVCDHFGISVGQACELFSANGCGHAKTAIEAAEYIENFVERHS
jgi:hypothetical protein